MAFNTLSFFVFWFVLYGLFLMGGTHKSWKTGVLLVGNLVFFGFLTQFALVLLLLASAIDFAIGQRIYKVAKDSSKKIWMRLSVVMNVGLILSFKHITDWLGLNQMDSDLHFPFPIYFIGVSFYAFRSMSYIFDIYYENIEVPESSLWHYWTYASFFPLMLSGPISNAGSFLETLRSSEWKIDRSELNLGAFYISSGIIKKFIIGNYISFNFIDRVFESAEFFTSMEVLLASILQTFALYFDFSGYTDIAIGLALWLGFKISPNFHFPFFAQNITEYWKRWHISLSQWFNAYVYFPLSYSLRRWKRFGTSVSVLVVFAISGFWHGTAPNYWLWGILHAISLVWDIFTANWRVQWRKFIPSFIYKPISILLTFAFLSFSGVYFKSQSIEAAHTMFLKMGMGIDWSLFGEWYALYSGVLWMSVIGIFGHYMLAPIYTKIESWVCRQSYFLASIVLFLVIVVAYQFDRLGSLPFYYLQF